MPRKPSLTLEEYLLMDETELMVELARAESAEPHLHSPESLLKEAEAYLSRIQSRLQALVCPHRDLMDLPEIKLATSLAGLLTGSFTVAVANIIAAYIVKRGLTEVCRGWRSANA